MLLKMVMLIMLNLLSQSWLNKHYIPPSPLTFVPFFLKAIVVFCLTFFYFDTRENLLKEKSTPSCLYFVEYRIHK